MPKGILFWAGRGHGNLDTKSTIKGRHLTSLPVSGRSCPS
jgi:hypothetical protein